MDAATELTGTYLQRVPRWWAGKGPAAKPQISLPTAQIQPVALQQTCVTLLLFVTFMSAMAAHRTHKSGRQPWILVVTRALILYDTAVASAVLLA
ncbi:TPA: hypothetical protein HH295_08315 [Xanthomonas vasicola pv. zeae]|uniref:Uncharacterized protein n=2 Tax=Xanthomonas vasicola TaxID=56459 RepID=A0AAE8F685_XANVA|nr:hypothetical protein C7V42_12040 [Xanthomonas vasicola pv. vasculorum]KFA34427.1 hypothetical protein KWI_0116970 [Xanthomonas vasicola pv. vasculorum NCPPB 206]TWQ17687.1 hypothetical protein FQK00_12195 [Xanthomonas vasicola]HHZ30703.1 hypothetical protein [Xanthomonas vasicola pv. zeae]AZM71430.1 hypothetical protein CXP37_12050 [Xanthomonas vasicola pv. vasculorum]